MTIPIISITRWKQTQDEDAASVAESQRDSTSFSVLYDRYVQPIYRYIYSRVGNVAEAEDLTSKTFLSALEALHSYKHNGNFAAWLYRIAHSKVIDYVRSRKSQFPLDETSFTESGDFLKSMADSEEIEHLRKLLRALDEDDQELIRLRYTVGLPFAQIAAIRNRSENSIKKNLYRVVARLQSQLEDR